MKELLRKVLQKIIPSRETRRKSMAILSLGLLVSHWEMIHTSGINYLVADKVVKLSTQTGTGTGFYVKAPSGKTYILTNRHICVSDGEVNELQIELRSHRSMKARIVEVSQETDLCLIEGSNNVVGLGVASSPSEEGDAIFIIGHPKGQSLTKTRGEVGVGYEVLDMLGKPNPQPSDCRDTVDVPFIFGSMKFCVERIKSQPLNAIVEPGNSGSPVVNMYGGLVGIIFAKRNDMTSKSFMVPASDIEHFLSVY